MKNALIVLVVLVVIIGGLMWWNSNNTLEAPAPEQNKEVGAVENTMPVLGPEGEGVEEAVVSEEGKVTVKEFTVTGKKFSFSPTTLTVQKGDKVKITFKNIDGFHDFKIDEYGIATAQKQSPAEEVLEFTADKAGSFEYYCSVGEHRALGMVGTLTVER